MKNKITSKQGTVIVLIFILGTSVVFNPGRSARADVWIAMIVSYILFIPIALIYSTILEKFPGKNIFKICEIVLGKFIGKVFIILFTFHAFISMAVMIRTLGEFIYLVGPQETPMVVNMICLGLLSVFSVYFGMNVLGRWCIIVLPMIVVILLIPIPFFIPEMKRNYIFPIMYEGIRPVISGVKETLSFPITQSFIFIMVFDGLEDIYKFKWVLLKGVFWGVSILFIIVLTTILVIGEKNYYNAYLPTYLALRRLKVGEFFERVEMVTLLTFVYTIFVKISIFLIATVRGIGYIFNIKDYRIISTMVVFLFVNLGYVFYLNSMEVKYFLSNIWPVYAPIFQVVLPFVLFVLIKLKVRKKVGTTGR